MSEETALRESTSDDIADLLSLYRNAFPNEDLVPLVRSLLTDAVSILSLVAERDGKLVGHIIFTDCSVSARTERVVLLGPLVVAAHLQKSGIGSALICEGLQRLKAEGAAQVFVLGDPAYYGRFGFVANRTVVTPYPLPVEWLSAWQSLRLNDLVDELQGNLSVPQAWNQPALWSP
jgi:putative acetyltransferase